MARAEFAGVAKEYGDTTALADFTLSIEDGELITVLGPSGCGKSTLLRLTAGLESLTRGSICLGGRRIDEIAPQERDVAMVFQSYALYPHMTVRGNIEFPLEMRNVAADERARSVLEIAELLEITPYLDRRPAQLSGGQRQRVALARALVRHPALFLLDEPLSNLDARLRLTVRRYIRQIQQRLKVTTLYVTHDQTEAMTLGDRIVVIHEGRIQQVDDPEGIYQRPENIFVAGFVGSPPMNLLPGHYAGGRLTIAGKDIAAPPSVAARLGRAASDLTIGIRPEALTAEAVDDDAAITAAVLPETVEALGSETLVRARVSDVELTARLAGTARTLPVRVAAPVGEVHVFGPDGRRIGGRALTA